ncbi:Dihydroneopterin triphosphate diphosphatase [Parasponia andersonii]|uniref:Dihydroneopterin triphosphate diphosphatase n=1 Tax=Parasponia andersonii TaxID=3476 RepID=A0A2P5DX75_PARAD|nr:Dihydroneopterin triphosphate diphosphatase [Parasponia andersonii]
MGSDRLQAWAGSERLKTLANHFRPYQPPQQQQQQAFLTKRAAVLVCLFRDDDRGGDLRVILTKRSPSLSTHSGTRLHCLQSRVHPAAAAAAATADGGEVALPGGKAEEGDASDVETALREAEEEIGLDPSLVNVVTVLKPFTTKNGLPVVPVIGVLSDKKAFIPAPNAAEVEAIFDAPLEMFLKDENRRAQELEWRGHKYLLHFFDFEADDKKFVIWALTAGILIEAASIVYQRPPAFLEQRPKFWSGCAEKQATMP